MASRSRIADQPPAASAVDATATASSPLESQAQSVANQLGCGTVKASATGGYIAPCGSHGVYIDCDAGRCRPTHTVKPEEYEYRRRFGTGKAVQPQE